MKKPILLFAVVFAAVSAALAWVMTWQRSISRWEAQASELISSLVTSSDRAVEHLDAFPGRRSSIKEIAQIQIRVVTRHLDSAPVGADAAPLRTALGSFEGRVELLIGKPVTKSTSPLREPARMAAEAEIARLRGVLSELKYREKSARESLQAEERILEENPPRKGPEPDPKNREEYFKWLRGASSAAKDRAAWALNTILDEKARISSELEEAERQVRLNL